MRVLQTLALPLGYVTVWRTGAKAICSRPLLWSGRRGSNPLPPPWQGGALPDELRPQNTRDYSRRFPVCQGGIFVLSENLRFHLTPGHGALVLPLDGVQEFGHRAAGVLRPAPVSYTHLSVR